MCMDMRVDMCMDICIDMCTDMVPLTDRKAFKSLCPYFTTQPTAHFFAFSFWRCLTSCKTAEVAQHNHEHPLPKWHLMASPGVVCCGVA